MKFAKLMAGFAAVMLIFFAAAACGGEVPPEPQLPIVIETYTSAVEILDQYTIKAKNAYTEGSITIITVFYDKARNATCFLATGYYANDSPDLECFEGRRTTPSY